MMKQKTLAAPARIEGVGLHFGEEVHVEVCPAPADAGVTFVRTDLPGPPRIAADLDHLVQRPRRTALACGEVEIHTVEHLMAAFWGLGIQNAEVRVDGPELPGLDGSALPFYEAMRAAGVAELEGNAREIRVVDTVAIQQDGASLVAFGRDGGLSISYTLDYTGTDSALAVPGTQYLSIELDGETFAREIAPARTFCLEQEARILREAGLGKGASTENTLVVGVRGVIENELRFEDEFVRHKILDLVGDLYLTRCHLSARVVATRSGHALNAELARAIRASAGGGSRAAETSPGAPVLVPPRGQPIDFRSIARILPHRYPFLLVDRVVEISADGMVGHGFKNVTANEEFFQGHFPGNPVMPGVLQIEALAQFAGIVLLSHECNAGKMAYLLSMNNVKFRRKVVPGDRLELEARVKAMKARSAEVSVKASVDGSVTTEASIRYVMVG